MNNTQKIKKGSRILSVLFALLFAIGGSVMLTGCEDEGPLEETGEEIDEGFEETGDELEDAEDDFDDDDSDDI